MNKALGTLWSPHFRKGPRNDSQKIQKGGLFDSIDEKGVLVKGVEQTLRRKRNL